MTFTLREHLQQRSANDRVHPAFPAMRWGSLGAFCALLLVWTSMLISNITLHGVVHLALVMAVLQLIGGIRRRLQRPSARHLLESAAVSSMPITDIREGVEFYDI